MRKADRARSLRTLRCTLATWPRLLLHARHQGALHLSAKRGLTFFNYAVGYPGSHRVRMFLRQ